METLFERFDAILDCRTEVFEYANGMCEALHEAEANAPKKVITTLGYDLGIACPSLVRHIVIGGHKRGKIIKKIPEGKNYQIISYDEAGNPVAFRSGNKFGLESSAHFFFNYNGYVWAVEMNKDGCYPYAYTIYRIGYNKDGKIESFYSFDSRSLIGEEYSYSDEEFPITCQYYWYTPTRIGTSKSIPSGHENSPMSEYQYLIFRDKIEGYKKVGDEFVFGGDFKRTKSKPTKSSYQQFSQQLDNILEQAASLKHCGVYFQLSEGNENEYRIYINLTSDFHSEDDSWACEVESSIGEIVIETGKETQWKTILRVSTENVNKYLNGGTYRDKLQQCKGVGVGFPDGDLNIC